MSFGDRTIYWDFFTRPHAQEFADSNQINGHFIFCAIFGKPFGRLGNKTKQCLYGTRGLVARAKLQNLA